MDVFTSVGVGGCPQMCLFNVCGHVVLLRIHSERSRITLNSFPAELHGASFKSSAGFRAPVWRSTCFLLMSGDPLTAERAKLIY